jgi:uncharacterized protein (TIGR02646 family)
MIRVVKPKKAPSVLATKGKAKSMELIAEYGRGVRAFKFDAKIYGHKTVKEALKKAQHDKCFLCESKISHIAHGDVEHFRPKAGYRQSAGGRLETPGYYWLAYEWSNLFLACQICNQVFKKNLFPLANPAARATSHKKSVSREDPLFIDPTKRPDPEKLISFRQEVPHPVNNDPRGQATIEGLGLKRQKLNERRFEHYELLRSLYELVQMNRPEPESSKARRLLDRMVQDAAPYASMARAAIRAKFQLRL